MRKLKINRQQILHILASDVWRPLIAGVIAGILVAAFEFGYQVLLGDASQTDVTVGFSFLGFFIFGVAYAVLCYVAFDHLNAEELNRTMKESDLGENPSIWKRFLRGGSGTIWALTFSAIAVLAVLTIAVLRGQTDRDLGYVTTEIGLATVIGAWFMNAVSYALHYAREDATMKEPGFRFPDNRKPVWSDYTYVAFKVSTSFATADVECLTTERRRLITRHSILSFAFNTVILAQLVAIVSPN